MASLMGASRTTYSASVRTNDEPAMEAAYARSAAEPPATMNVTRKAMPSAVLEIEARRRRRWYLEDLSSFITRSERSGRSERSDRSIELNGDQFRNARFLHCDPVQSVGDLHRPPVVRDEDELRPVEHAAQHLDEPSDVRIVERRVDFVEQAERARSEEHTSELQSRSELVC